MPIHKDNLVEGGVIKHAVEASYREVGYDLTGNDPDTHVSHQSMLREAAP